MSNGSTGNTGRAFVKGREDRARFATYIVEKLDQWRYAENGRAFTDLSNQTGVSMDQISKWLRMAQVPSRESVEKLWKIGVLPMDPDQLAIQRPWRDYEMAEMPKPKSKSKPAPNRVKKTRAPEVSTPEFEVVAPDIYDVINGLDISAKAKMQLSAITALLSSGAVLDIEIRARAR